MRTLKELLLAVCLLGVSCKTQAETAAEAVMSPGETVVAQNANGRMIVSALSVKRRRYQWDGKEKTIELIPRTERWNGVLGLYNPGSEIFPMTLLNRTRTVAQEAELHFDSTDEALAWLQRQRPMQWVYSSEELVLGWFEMPARHQINKSTSMFIKFISVARNLQVYRGPRTMRSTPNRRHESAHRPGAPRWRAVAGSQIANEALS